MRSVDLLLRKSQVVRGTAAQDILSLKAQETKGRAWAKRNRYEVRRIYRENLSAYKLTVKRPDFDAAVHALLEGESDCLWAYDSSRYSRKGAGDVLKILDSPGKRLVFDINGLDTERPEDRRRIIEDAERDREYSRVLSQKVKDTKAQQREEGKWLAGAPYGLKVTKKRKLKHGKFWPVIERIHYEAAEGASNRKIALGLTADGYRSTRGGPFRSNTVGKILRNPVYLGWQVVMVKRQHQIYLNAKGKPVRVFAKGVEGIPQAIFDKHRRIAAGFERRKNLPTVEEQSKSVERSPASGLMWCDGGGRDPKKGHLATIHGGSFRCGRLNLGLDDCPGPVTGMRASVVRVLSEEWGRKLSTADKLDPTLLAVGEGWVELSQPEESKKEADARGQLKLAEEVVARIDRLEAAGAFPGRDGEATYVRQRRAAVEDVENARKDWEAVAQPMADISVLTDPVRAKKLWESSDDTYRGQLLRLAIERVYLKKAPYSGARFTADRLDIVWKKPRGWKPPKEEDGQPGASGS
ncbi:recombinase family protein [Streptomyces sp. FH025]|uniref:recombinase family protein n=1 Tax=Streptomyces sp. FH025 TaxID=2815937 RepID=UPI001A9EF719|nr:recombinase family protein [Streptomyces sp. FH025]MBO1418339.1 recombinase family protein [Streptomyces sp. FH025]